MQIDVFGAGGILVVAIPFLVQQLKKLSFIGSRFAPLVAFILGIGGGVVGYLAGMGPEGMTLIQAILVGATLGGTSTGLYDVMKKTVN